MVVAIVDGVQPPTVLDVLVESLERGQLNGAARAIRGRAGHRGKIDIHVMPIDCAPGRGY